MRQSVVMVGRERRDGDDGSSIRRELTRVEDDVLFGFCLRPFTTPRLQSNRHHLPLSRGSHTEHVHITPPLPPPPPHFPPRLPQFFFDKDASGGKELSLKRQAIIRLQPNTLLAYGRAS